MEKSFGKSQIQIKRLTDNIGALNSQERAKITKALEKIERRISPVALAVYFPEVEMHNQFLGHAFWALNHGVIAKDTFRWRKAPVKAEWLLMLVIDIRSGLACFTWGYQLDPYIDVNRINSCIIQARLSMRDNDFVEAIPAIMHKAALHIARQAHRIHRHSILYPILRSITLMGLSSALVFGSAHAASHNMPTWAPNDSKQLMKGEWWNKQLNSTLKPQTKTPQQQSFLPLTTSEELKRLPLLPENDAEVLPIFLPEYPLAAVAGIIDPQKLLNQMEKEELQALLSSVQKYNKVKFYISIFAKDQKVPAALNAPTLARSIFHEGERSILLHIHLGDSKKTQISYDAELTAALPEDTRRSMLNAIKEHAKHFNEPSSVLFESVRLLARLSQPSIQKLNHQLKPQTNNTHTDGSSTEIPPVPLVIPTDPVQHHSSMKELILSMAEGKTGIALFTTLIIATLLSLITVWIRLRRHVQLQPSDADLRLDATVGAGVSRAVNYKDGKETSKSSSSGLI